MKAIRGQIYDDRTGAWRRKLNKELQEEVEMASVIKFIRGQMI